MRRLVRDGPVTYARCRLSLTLSLVANVACCCGESLKPLHIVYATRMTRLPRGVRVAQEDAKRDGSRRKLKQFFSKGNGVCELCGYGLGKRYTRKERRDHEKGWQHLDNYAVYEDAFYPARREYEDLYRANLRREKMQLVKQFTEELIDECGATKWIKSGDATKLKATFWDVLRNETSVQELAKTLEEHKTNVQSMLLETAVATSLVDTPHEAYTVSTLVSGYN
jgi:hypothetical protein